MSVAFRDGRAAGTAGQGIAVMCLGVFCLTINDVLAKWLTAHYGVLQIVFMRNLLALPMIAAIVVAIGGRRALGTRHLRIHAWRGLLSVGAAYAFFSGLAVLPLAEATSLIFAAPIFITALSVPLLGEKVGWRRWAAVIVGFVGVVIIVRPGAATFQPASLYVVATALFYAILMISARWIDRAESVWTMMFHVVLFPTIFSGLMVPFDWQTPEPAHLLFWLGMAVFGTLGITLIGHAFRLGQAAVVAPFDYTALVWASLFGFLFFAEVPATWTYLGAAVIIASGIYIVFRETRTEGQSASRPSGGGSPH